MKKLIVGFAVAVTVLAGCGQGAKESKAGEEKVKSVQISETHIEANGDHEFTVSAKTDSKDVTYAYSIYRDNKVVDKVSYQEEDTFTYKTDEPGVYFVKIYAKDANGKVDTQFTGEAKLGEPKKSH
ncbi:hypothetical protein [Bacillus manliponensis]|uniref:hypothetical protein n=1 Tax=Bacillus manliponensis TaxID=574376 RepID=UPI0035189C8D